MLWPLFLAALLGQTQDQRSILSELENLDRTLREAELALKSSDKARSASERKFTKTQTDIAAAKVRKEEAFVQYARRLRALHRMKGGARLLILGESSSLAEYLSSKRILRMVTSYDQKVQNRYQKRLSELEVLEGKLQEQTKRQKELVLMARRERDRIAKKRQERVSLLESLKEQDNLRELTRREKQRARKHLGGMVAKMKPRGTLSADFSRNRGRLPWPALGEVSARFGKQTERVYGTVTMHSGWDIRAPQGSEVKAVAEGRVVFSNWLKGYGQLVILDHGSHFHTLMAHLSEVRVEVGQFLKSGEVVGSVGDTGSMRGTLLYFELREKGKPMDPGQWLRP